MKYNDDQFFRKLKEYCSVVQETSDPILPVFYNEDRIDRVKTLSLPAYNMSEDIKKDLLS